MDFRKTKAPLSTITRDMNSMCEPTGNVYETVNIIGKRANQISLLIRDELDHISRCMNGKLHIWYVLSSDELGADWRMGRGHIDLECLQQHLPPPPSVQIGTDLGDTLALVCGPPAMEASVSAGLQKLGWSVEQNIVFF